MGMFDKDKLYSGTPLEKWVSIGVDFILYGARIATDEFPVEGPDGAKEFATKSELFVATMEQPNNVVKVSTLSSVTAEKVKDAEDSDFPAVCQFQTVPSKQSAYSDAKVVRFVRAYESDDIPSFNPDEVEDAPVVTAG